MGVRCASDSELRSDFGTERTCVGAPALTRHVPLLTFPFLFLTVGRRSQRLDERTRIKFASVPQSPAGFTTLHGSCGCGNLQVRRGQRVLSQVVLYAWRTLVTLVSIVRTSTGTQHANPKLIPPRSLLDLAGYQRRCSCSIRILRLKALNVI
jgi:hypothetical protein